MYCDYTQIPQTSQHVDTYTLQSDEDRQEDGMLLYQQIISIKTSIKAFHACCQHIIQSVDGSYWTVQGRQSQIYLVPFYLQELNLLSC